MCATKIKIQRNAPVDYLSLLETDILFFPILSATHRKNKITS